jgi:hypothetical protein
VSGAGHAVQDIAADLPGDPAVQAMEDALAKLPPEPAGTW